MKKIEFNTFDITEFGGKKKIQDAYPELLAYSEYSKVKVNEWKVAILLTDMASPFIKIKDHNHKIDEIFRYLKIDKTRGSGKNIYDSAYNYSPSGVMDACSFLLMYQNNHDFANWFEQNIIYYNLLKRLREPLKEGENEDSYYKTKFGYSDQIDKLATRLKKLELDLFATSEMKAAAFRSQLTLRKNYAEKYAVEGQVE